MHEGENPLAVTVTVTVTRIRPSGPRLGPAVLHPTRSSKVPRALYSIKMQIMHLLNLLMLALLMYHAQVVVYMTRMPVRPADIDNYHHSHLDSW
jgi:hypothetical protein